MLKMVLLLICYLATPVVVGHGLLPMALVLVSAHAVMTWGTAMAWTAIIVLGVGFSKRPTATGGVAQLAAAALLYGSWGMNVHHFMTLNAQGEQTIALESMLLLSIPLQLSTLLVFWIGALRLSRLSRSSKNFKCKNTCPSEKPTTKA